MKLDDVPHDRQADPEPAVLSRAGRIGLAKAVEDVRQELGADPRAVVDHHQPRIARRAIGADVDVPAGLRELHRVGKQVPHDLLQAIRVAVHLPGLHLVVPLERDLFCLGRRACGVDRRLHHLAKVDLGALQPHLAGRHARHVEHVFH